MALRRAAWVVTERFAEQDSYSVSLRAGVIEGKSLSKKQNLREMYWSSRITVAVALAFLTFLAPAVHASIFSEPALSYCKCICFTNSTIIPLFRPSDPSKPCLSCTKQFCLDQKLAICRDAELPELDKDVGTGTEGDVEARCFKRDSPRDELIVTFFALTVVGMLLYAAVRNRYRKAIEARGRPTDLREWTQALVPERLQPMSANLLAKAGVGRDHPGHRGEIRMGDYAPVTTSQ